MSCESCYNGCVEIVSDECVRYTGINYPALGIETGDTLVSVEQAIMNALVPLLTGVGDEITLSAGDVCALITGYLTAGLTHTSKEWITALAKGECNLQGQVTAINATLAILNANYTIECLTGVTASSDTHDIVQAIITKLCATAASLTALSLDVSTNYVKLADLNTLIQAYLNSISGGTTQQNAKMIPLVAYEYYGPLTNFDATGAGISTLGWDKVFLCNGSNGTPDKRGRVAVGAINNVPGGPLNANVDPANAGNPNYSLYTISGTNTVTLTSNQIPSHTHLANVLVTELPHNHSLASTGTTTGGGEPFLTTNGTLQVDYNGGGTNNYNYKLVNSTTPLATLGKTSSVSTNVAVGVTNNNTGGGQSHPNIQPVIAAYYIMYIP
jgi:microcystin-dependent protein